jgi:hypothetical protein
MYLQKVIIIATGGVKKSLLKYAALTKLSFVSMPASVLLEKVVKEIQKQSDTKVTKLCTKSSKLINSYGKGNL